jgi:hypothetical protein
MSDADWSDMAKQLGVGPQQIYWKVNRIIKEETKKTGQDPKPSKREMITRALMGLPGQRGTKQEIFSKIEQIF